MALWHCAACTAAYAVGTPRCPQCGSTEREGEAQMPKINRAGASYEPGRDPDGAPAAAETPRAADEDGAGPGTAPEPAGADEGQPEVAPADSAAELPAPGPAGEPKPAPARAQPKKAADA